MTKKLLTKVFNYTAVVLVVWKKIGVKNLFFRFRIRESMKKDSSFPALLPGFI